MREEFQPLTDRQRKEISEMFRCIELKCDGPYCTFVTHQLKDFPFKLQYDDKPYNFCSSSCLKSWLLELLEE